MIYETRFFKHTRRLVYLVLSTLLLPAAVMADQLLPVNNEIRYVNRDKGESNQALPLTVAPATDARHQPANELHADGTTGLPLLWKIERDGVMSSYLFGTIHVDDRRVMELPDSVTWRLQTTDRLLLELKLDQRTAIDSLRKMVYTDGRSLQQAIGDDLYRDVSTAIADTQLPENLVTVLKPWAAMIILLRPDNSSGTFLDKRLAAMARRSGIEVVGLESVNEQLNAFDQMPLDDQKRMLADMLTQLPDKQRLYDELLSAWLDGDLARLYDLGEAGLPQDPGLAEQVRLQLIDSRNWRMYQRLLPELSQGNRFIAVGALHLPGEQGLLRLIRDAGYRVSRVGIDRPPY